MKAYLNDLGINCSLGNDKASVLAAMTNNHLPQSEWLSMSTTLEVSGRSVWVGQVNSELPSLESFERQLHSRNNQLALSAYQQIATSIQVLSEGVSNSRIAVVIGTSTSGIREGELARRSYLNDGEMPEHYDYATQEMAAPADFIAKLSGAQGPVYSISTACSSSAKALATAKMMLESDVADLVICGGVDSLCQLTINGFNALESLSADKCQSFGQARDGINIGEAAALFVMSKQPADVALLGAGESSDAYHISAPHPEGLGAMQSMQAAMDNANLLASAIDYINAHGTGTPKNDAMEATAIYQTFGDNALVSSTKRMTGHTLGAAGALEAGLCWLIMQPQNQGNGLPMNVDTQELDQDLAGINIITEPTRKTVNVCLSNSFAFGGNNCSLILGKTSA
ncbi:beta-ketoacyl-ACP synthase [Thalassotalea fusca]